MDDNIHQLIESRVDPDGKTFWIDYRPLPATWDDPRTATGEKTLPDGIKGHHTPAGRPFFVDTRPRLSWAKPVGYGGEVCEGEPDGVSCPSFPGFTASLPRVDTGFTKVPSTPVSRKSTGSSASQLHPDLKLLMTLTRWRLAHLLSGYPDTRVADVDAMITILQTRINAFSNIDDLPPLEGWFIKGIHGVISSQPNMNFLQPTQGGKMNIFDGDTFDPVRLIWSAFFLPLLFTLLLGVPVAYKHRLGRAQWTQWVSSKRWAEQQQAMDGFLKALIAEWNLMILPATLILSASVGFLSVEGMGDTTETAILVSLVFSLASISIDVAFVWRYQRQLTNSFDMQTVMDEFIFKADEDILAMFLSLPVAFFLWSLLLFAVGVVAYAWKRLPATYSAVGVTAAMGIIFIVTSTLWGLHRWKWLIRDNNGSENGKKAPYGKTPFGARCEKGVQRSSRTINLDDPELPRWRVHGDGGGSKDVGGSSGGDDVKQQSMCGTGEPFKLLDEAATV
ncbi:hypothetical protein FRB93_006537 [Tulasnella sp. JGI-2019a]|nr:hypothetical protein FRB93_006537 [Tulasnella sp. JGI-2019a]